MATTNARAREFQAILRILRMRLEAVNEAITTLETAESAAMDTAGNVCNSWSAARHVGSHQAWVSRPNTGVHRDIFA